MASREWLEPRPAAGPLDLETLPAKKAGSPWAPRATTPPTDHNQSERPPNANKPTPRARNWRSLMLAATLTLATLIRPADSAVTVKYPFTKTATLVLGQPLHFECFKIAEKNAQFLWYKRNLVQPTDDESHEPAGGQLQLLDPNQDDSIEIHNERLTLLKPNYLSLGDYICRALNEDKTPDERESDTIRLRAQPWVEDFGLATSSHTGKSATVTDGERLELLCRVRDESVPVNITWLVSREPEDDWDMVVVPEHDPGHSSVAAAADQAGASPTYIALPNVMVEHVSNFAKRLVIRQLGPENRGYYTCVVDNRVTAKTQKTIFIRVKDKIVSLWPFLGILAELFILFTIIYVWETQRAQRSLMGKQKAPLVAAGSGPPTKRTASGPSNPYESVPLNG